MKINEVGIRPNSSRSTIDSRTTEKFSQLLKSRFKEAGDKVTTNEKIIEYTVKPGDTLWKIGIGMFGEDPYKIAKENSIPNPDLIYPGQTLEIRKSAFTSPQVVTASWYGNEYHNRPTASGERFDMFKNTLAHRTLPLGTMVRLTHPQSGKMTIAKINDRGPFIKGRDVDLSYGLAKQMGLVEKGIGQLIMEIL